MLLQLDVIRIVGARGSRDLGRQLLDAALDVSHPLVGPVLLLARLVMSPFGEPAEPQPATRRGLPRTLAYTRTDGLRLRRHDRESQLGIGELAPSGGERRGLLLDPRALRCDGCDDEGTVDV